MRVTDTVNNTITSSEMTIAGPTPKNSIQTKASFGSYGILPDRRLDDDISLAIDLSKITFSDGSELIVPEEPDD